MARIGRRAYAEMFGPTVGDRLRLADTQLVIEVEGPITIETDHFRFARTFEGFEVVPQKGTLIGHDGDREVRTPFDDCVMVMPSREPLKGKTAVRLGRIV